MDAGEKEEIRARTDIAEIIGAYTTLKKNGSRYKGLCPFHQEKTPSFTVNPEMGRYHCFGCGESGDVFTFLEKMEGLTFIEAAERLAERAGMTLSRRGVNREESQRIQSEKERLFTANAAALRFFRESFNRASLAREYAEQRGLVHETREAFGVGYAPDDWSQLAGYLMRQKIHPDDAVRAGLITPSRRGDGTFTDRFRGRLMFPIVDVQERVVGFGGRLIVPKEDAPKYLNSPETPVFSKSKTLYALNRAKRAISDRDLAVVVEGYMDAIAAHQAGIGFVIATLGTALTAEHVSLIRRYTKNVALSFDADAAGVRAAIKAAEILTASGDDMSLRVLALPPGEDPDSLIKSGNVGGFRRAIDDALTVPVFRLKSLENQHDIRTEQGRVALLKDAVQIIAQVPSLLEQDALIQRVVTYHPTYASNSLRAEESVRAEVLRARTGKPDERGEDGSDFGNSPPAPLPPPGRRGGASTYRAGNHGNNGTYNPQFGGGNGAPGQRRQYGAKPGYGGYQNRNSGTFVLPDTVPIPQLPPSSEVAERTLLRGLLADEWVTVALPLVAALAVKDGDAPPFFNPLSARLVEVLWPLLSGKVPPATALARLTDPDLLQFADVLLMSDDGPHLSRETLEDALLQIQKRQKAVKNRQIAQKIEGNTTPDEEELRRWTENVKSLRRGVAPSE